MLAGNGALYLSLVMIVMTKASLPSYLDAVAVFAVILMIVTRRLDITHFAGRTMGDEPATLAHWRRHTMLLVITAAAAWLLAHYIAGNLLA